MTYMMTAAIAAVTKNVPIVMPMTLPARLALDMFAIADAIEQKTMGTTTQNMRLTKTVPMGSRTVAPLEMTSPDASLTTGLSAPTTQPPMIPASMNIINP